MENGLDIKINWGYTIFHPRAHSKKIKVKDFFSVFPVYVKVYLKQTNNPPPKKKYGSRENNKVTSNKINQSGDGGSNDCLHGEDTLLC